MRLKLNLVAAALLLHSHALVAQFTINPTNNASVLVNTGLLGAGVQASNISGQLDTGSAGLFSSTSVTGMPFSNGLLLTTGDLNSLPFDGPATTFLSTGMNMPGDSTLDSVVTPYITYDASVLEFDFSAAGDSVEFYFIFSSEEYNDYANTVFNDVFGFFVTGPGYTPNTNVALLPGTTIPISINNVNNGGPAPGTASGPCLNCAYYVDNVNTGNVALAPDGFTTAIQIKFAVQPCTSYHFKIAVADVNDPIFDSQVFIQQGSFVACPLQISANNVYVNPTDTVWVCQGESVTLSSPTAPAYSWSNGATTQTISVSQTGTYSMAVTNQQTACFAFSNSVWVMQADSVNTPLLTGSNDTIYSGISTPGLTYTWSVNGAVIPGADLPYLPGALPGCYTLTVSNQAGCDATSAVFCLTSLSEAITPELIIHPHPVSGISQLEIPFDKGSECELILLDVSGQVVQKQQVRGGETAELNSSGLAKGMYLLMLKQISGGRTIQSKILIQ
jgi:Secretion system C-terminal sorting domain